MKLNGRWFPRIGTVGIYIQYIFYSLVLIFVGGGGGVSICFFTKTILSHFILSHFKNSVGGRF